MTRRPRLIQLISVALLLNASAILAVENGQPDGDGHPAVGFIIGTKGDPCSGDQFLGFGGVLIGPDVFLTTGNIALETQLHIDEGFFDTAWIILDPEPLVAPTVPVRFDCTKFVRVVSIVVNPVYLNDPDRNEGDVGVLMLETSQTVPPADLPVQNRLRHLSKQETLTYVGFGRIQDPGQPSGFDLTTLMRRFTSIKTRRPIKGETMNVDLDPSSTGGFDPCITNVSSGGPAIVGATNEIVSLAVFPNPGCHVALPFQRLDVASVRVFLSGFVTLP